MIARSQGSEPQNRRLQMRRFALCAARPRDGGGGSASAQDQPLSAFAQTRDVRAARRRSTARRPDALRIIGSQDPTPRALFGDRDLLVIGGGSSAGVQLGQQFFIRRTITGVRQQDATRARHERSARCASSRSTTPPRSRVVDHICGGIVAADHLEPFVEPPAATAETSPTTGEPARLQQSRTSCRRQRRSRNRRRRRFCADRLGRGGRAWRRARASRSSATSASRACRSPASAKAW